MLACDRASKAVALGFACLATTRRTATGGHARCFEPSLPRSSNPPSRHTHATFPFPHPRQTNTVLCCNGPPAHVHHHRTPARTTAYRAQYSYTNLRHTMRSPPPQRQSAQAAILAATAVLGFLFLLAISSSASGDLGGSDRAGGLLAQPPSRQHLGTEF
jgi:hypothetical protein